MINQSMSGRLLFLLLSTPGVLGSVTMKRFMDREMLRRERHGAVAVCLAGETRGLLRPSTLQLLAQHFWKPDYRLFLSLEKNVPARLLQQLQAALGVNASGIELRDVPVQRLTPCSPQIYGMSTHLREKRLLPMARRIESCASQIEAAMQRGERFQLVVRSRPDFRFTQPVPHVRELLAKGGAATLMWDDQLMIAQANDGLLLMRAAPLVYANCATPEQWATGCGGTDDVDPPMVREKLASGASPCAPMLLSRALVPGSPPPLRSCGLVWDSRCHLLGTPVLAGVDIPPRWSFFEKPVSCRKASTPPVPRGTAVPADWLRVSQLGYCRPAQANGNCECGQQGSWQLSRDELTDRQTAIAACGRRCAGCARCNYFSVSRKHRDCSWFHSCDMNTLRRDVSGFLTAPLSVPTFSGPSPSDAHLIWMGDAVSGSCGVTRDGDSGDCERGDKGSWRIGTGAGWQREGWTAAAQDCVTRCSKCSRCRYISLALGHNDCSWYAACDMNALVTSVAGVRSGPMISGPRVSPLGEASRAVWPTSVRVDAAVAIQVSGHLREGCRLDHIAANVLACRRRFARCDVFLHTYKELEPRTPHWSGTRHKRAGSSRPCAAQAARLLGAVRYLVDEQPPPPPEDSPAPDGRPFTERNTLGWGAQRHHGWMMNVRGMFGATRLRQEAEAKGAECMPLRDRTRN